MKNEDIVTQETKKLWKIELELLEKFKEVCKKNGFRYFASGGTLIGAVRHKGFIPWDDDIDIVMPWNDYKLLLKIAADEFEPPYFFQSYLTEKLGEVCNSTLRHSNTTGCTKWEHENIGDPLYNRGIFIDIFPLFYVPVDDEFKKQQKSLIMDIWKAIRGYNVVESRKYGLVNINPEYIQYVDDYLKYSKQYTIEELKSLYLERCAVCKIDTGYIGVTSYRCFHPNFVWESSWYKETIELPFENTMICCPKEYDKILTKQYGDWRKPVYNGANHTMYIFDADMPWKKKLKLG